MTNTPASVPKERIAESLFGREQTFDKSHSEFSAALQKRRRRRHTSSNSNQDCDGEEKLQRIQTIDKAKQELANKLDIRLIVIPDLISTPKYVNQVFANISSIVQQLLQAAEGGIEP